MKCKWHLCEKDPRKKSEFCSKNCQNNFSVNKRRKDLKLMSVEYKGGKCSCCGFVGHPTVFDFHHLDPAKKDFAISRKGYTRSWNVVKEELDKCVMLCANCHREVHAGVKDIM